MALIEKEIQGKMLDSVTLNRAEADSGPDNLWAMTLQAGADERVYLLTSDHLRLLAAKVFERLSS